MVLRNAGIIIKCVLSCIGMDDYLRTTLELSSEQILSHHPMPSLEGGIRMGVD